MFFLTVVTKAYASLEMLVYLGLLVSFSRLSHQGGVCFNESFPKNVSTVFRKVYLT